MISKNNFKLCFNKSKKKVAVTRLKYQKNLRLIGENSTSRSYVLSSSRGHRLANFSGLRITFLGTSSAKATRSRNVTSIVVESEKYTWMFDCGDGTQRQMLYSHIQKTKLECIFITHLHGDHCFGLPSVICTLLFMDSTMEKLHIYGPAGLYDMIHKSLSTSSSVEFIWKRVVIHEFVENPNMINQNNNPINRHQIYVPSKGSHLILENENYLVHVARITHSVSCFGFVIEEKSLIGNLNVELLDKYNVPSSPIRRELKECSKTGRDPREIFPFPEEADLSNLVAPSITGRKIVLLGDTSDPSNIFPKGIDCDLLIHEATFEAEDEQKALKCKHSSTRMAGKAASQIKAKTLCITHFSVRYRRENMSTLLAETSEFFKNGDIIAARDFLSIDILPRNDRNVSHGFKRDLLVPKIPVKTTGIKKRLIKKKRKLKSKLITRE